MVAATAGKADPSSSAAAGATDQWVMVEKGEAGEAGWSTQPPTPGPEGEEDGDGGAANGRRSRMDVKIQ